MFPDQMNQTGNINHRIDDQIKEEDELNIVLNGIQSSYLASLVYFKQQINQFRNEYCDFTICIGETKFQVHRYILITWSDFFRGLFRHKSLESNSNTIIIEDISVKAMESILNFCYQFKLDLDNDNVQEILFASCKLQIKKCQELCTQYIKSQIDDSNCLGVLAVADRYNIHDLFETTLEYCLDNFLKITRAEEFSQLDARHMKKLISSDELNVSNEIDIVNNIFKWYESNANESDLDEIMSQVRFSLMKPKELIDLSKDEKIVRLGNCVKLINEAKDFHLLDSLHQLEECRILNKPRLTLQLRQRIYAIGGWSTKQHSTARVEMYNPYRDEWSEVEPMLSPRCALSVAILGNYIYAIGGHNGQVNLKSVERYNLKTGQWSNDVANISVERCSHSAVTLDGFIYNIGGQKNTNNADKSIQSMRLVEKYNPATNTWTRCDSLRTERLGAGVTTLKGYIYVIGGSANKDTLSSVERYDTLIDQWDSVAPMRTPRKHFGCTSLNGLIFVYGGKCCQDGQENDLQFGEVYDPVTNTWSFIKEMPTKRSGLNLVALDNLIYAIGGNDLKLVEVYNPSDNTWGRVRDMICPRLAGGLVVHSKCNQ